MTKKEKINILTVDDERDILYILEEEIREWGHESLLANSGEEALKLLNMAPIHVILSDVKMPQMTGPQLVERIKDAQGGLRPSLIFVTGTQMSQKEAFEAGGDAVVHKPIDFETLRAAVEHFGARSIELGRHLV